MPAERARPSPYLVAQAVTAGYGPVPVIRDVSLGVGAGEIVAIIGPNGAGKSTLLKAMVGILRVVGGSVQLGAEDVTNRAPEVLARLGIGYVPQVGDIFEPLTVQENLEMGGFLLPREDLSRRIGEVCAVFPRLAGMLRRRADKLSGGERKMLAVARVLMLDPRVLLLDEPTANLSPQLADALLCERVRDLARSGKAVVLVEQRAKAAMQIADWTMVLVSGSARLEGRPDDLLGRPDFEAAFLGAGGAPAHGAAAPARPATP